MVYLYTVMVVTSHASSTNRVPGRPPSCPGFVFARQKCSALIGQTVRDRSAPIGSPESRSDKLMHVRDRFQHIFVPWTVDLAAMLEMRLDLSSEPRLRFCVFSGHPGCMHTTRCAEKSPPRGRPTARPEDCRVLSGGCRLGLASG